MGVGAPTCVLSGVPSSLVEDRAGRVALTGEQGQARRTWRARSAVAARGALPGDARVLMAWPLFTDELLVRLETRVGVTCLP